MYAGPVRNKVCANCRKRKDACEFQKSNYTRKKHHKGIRALRSWCRRCETERHRLYVAANKDYFSQYRSARYYANKAPAIAHNLKRYYGLTIDDYNALFQIQKGRCAICKQHQSKFERRFDVDHNHKTKKVRGLLCIRCNRGIGLLQDSLKILFTAAAYLKNRK